MPQDWGGYAGGGNADYGLFKTYLTGASTAGWTFSVSGVGSAGVQRNGSAWSPSGPYASGAAGSQTAFIQSLGQAATVVHLEPGKYRLGFKLAGRGTSGQGFAGNQTISVILNNTAVPNGSFNTTTGSGFITRSVVFDAPSAAGDYTLVFAGQQSSDQTALLDSVTLIPVNNDIYSLKVLPLDRVEDRNGNYMHIDYGGTHEPQNLTNPDGSVTQVDGTLVDSYGNAQLPTSLFGVASVKVALVAQGARPALEMHPRRITYGMRTLVPGNGNNLPSVSGVEVARVILNYECIDGSLPDIANGSCASRPGVKKLYDSGAGQMLMSKRLASISTLLSGSDDTSLASDRASFHANEINTTYNPSAVISATQCLNGSQAICGTLMRRYTLAYGNSPSSGRLRLNSVTEWSGDGVPLPATNFEWQESALTLSATGQGYQPMNDGLDWNNLLDKGRVADVVGDGRSRIVKHENGENALRVCTHDPSLSKFICSSWPVTPPAGKSIPNSGSTDTWNLADYTGDGIADLVVATDTTAFACPAVWRDPATGTIDPTQTIANAFGTCVSLPGKTGVRSTGGSTDKRYYSRVGDFNGDGRVDVMFYRGNGSFEICLAPFASCQNTLATVNLGIAFADPNTEKNHQIVADFNGDGRADIAYRINNLCVSNPMIYNPTGRSCLVEPSETDSYWAVCFAGGADGSIGFQCATHSAADLLGGVKAVSGKISKIAIYDFNGDGLADLGALVPGQGWRVCLSTGDGEFADRTPSGECPIWDGPVGSPEKTVAGDFNGDGRTDLATWVGTFNTDRTWQICRSTGSGFVCTNVLNGPYKPADCQGGTCTESFVGDYNGDGKSDLAVNTNCVVECGRLSYGFTDGTMPDMLSTITTGLGALTKVAYEPLSKPNGVYQKAATIGAGDPDPGIVQPNEIVIQSPMYVVSSTLASTGTGSYFKSSYNYQSLRADKWGRGLSGFYRRLVTDNVIADGNGTVTNSSQMNTTGFIYNQSWPNIGRPRLVAKAATSVAISSTTLSYGSRSRLSGVNRTNGASGQYAIYEVFQTQSVQTGNDLNGAALPTTTVYTGPAGGIPDEINETLDTYYDSYGNPKKIVTIVSNASPAESWTQIVRNFYYSNGGDTTRWLLGKLQYAVTESSAASPSFYSTQPDTSTGCVSNAGTATYSGGTPTNAIGKLCRTSSFAYQGYGGSCSNAVNGQLCTETVEPDYVASGDRTLYQQSAYEYDGFGNRAKGTVSYYEGAAGASGLKLRSSETSYLTGKYPTTTIRRFVANSINALDLSDTREYNDGLCRMPTQITDANGNYAKMTYDGFCRKTSESAWTNDGKLVKQTLWELASAASNPSAAALGITLAAGEVYAQRTSTTEINPADPSPSAGNHVASLAYFDNLQRTVRGQAKTFDGSFSSASTVFDGYGRQYSVTKPTSGAAGGFATTSYAYDALNRPTTETLPDGTTVTTIYSGLTTTVTRTNDPLANPGTAGATNSAQPHVTQKTVNAKGLVASVTTGTITTTLSYLYDALGALTQVTSPGSSGLVTKKMVYDLRGRQTQLQDPLNLDTGTYTYAYNGAGEQTSQIDARGYLTTTQYDSFGRKKTRTESQAPAMGGDVLTTWAYDCANGKGLLCSVSYGGTGGNTNATSKTTTYDLYSRPVATSTTIGSKSFSSQVAYDTLGRPKYSIYPQATAAAAALSIKTTYNASGYATQVENATTGQIYSTITSRNADGQVATATIGNLLAQSNGYSADGLGRIASINIAGGTTLTQTFAFESIGNLKSRSLNAPGVSRIENEAFAYDALDRLIQSSGSGITDAGYYAIDAAGNLINKGSASAGNTATGGVFMGHAPNSNRLCNIGNQGNSGCTVFYDANGNILSYTRPSSGAPGADGATLTLSNYTAFNLPTTITKSVGGSVQASAGFYYDGGYQRVRQVKRGLGGAFVDDILYVVPGGFEVRQDASGNLIKSTATVSGPDGIVATVTTNFDPTTGMPTVASGTAGQVTQLSGVNTITTLILKDHLGSMVAEFTLTASSAGTLNVHGFGPWGNARAGLNTDQRGFTGHEHLAELGLIHMNGRLYDPVIGRFLQADPVIQAPHNAQSHNRYSYVLNNPLSFTDPSGFSFWTKWRTTVVAIAASIVTAGAASAFVSAYMYAGLLGDVVGAAMQATIAATSNFVGAVAGGFAAGGISGGNIQSALQGAFTAALTFGVGEFSGAHSGGAMSLGQRAGQVAGHAAVGCGSAAMAGGSCRAGAMSAGFSAFAGHVPVLSNTSLIGRAVVGAIASKLSGGKAENGALSAAFQYLFNDVATAPRPRGGGKLGIITALLTAGAAVINSQSSSSSGEDSQKEKTFVTYTLDGPSGEVYGGRTSGYGTPDEVVNQRFKYHHMRLLGYGNPTVDRSASGDDGAAAIRGREQDIIDGHGGVGSPYVGNSINGISIINPFRPIYLGASLQRFGVYVPGQ